MVNKRLINTGVEAAPAVFDPLQNFETVTYTGNGGTQKITGYIRKGAAFNGSSSAITNSNQVIPNGASSISFWYNPNGSTGTEYILGQGIATASKGITVYYSSSTFGALVAKGVSSLAGSATTTTTYSNTDWHHVVATWDGTTTTNSLKVYVNGSLEAQGTSDTSSASIGAYTYFAMGGLQGNTYAEGKIDQVRIFDKAISSSEVTTLYNETYASSTKSTTDIFGDGSGVALYELDEDANSSNFAQAAVFNGSSSKISATGMSLTEANISLWLKLNTLSKEHHIFSFDYNSTNGFLLFYEPTTFNSLSIIDVAGDYVTLSLLPSNTIQADTWYHISLNITSTQATLYLNGVAQTPVSNNRGNTTFPMPFELGYATTRDKTDAYLNGSIDQVRIYDTALSSGDITNLYNESSVPTSGLVAHYKLDGDATDETGSYDGTETSITYSAGVYGGTPTNVNFLGMAFQPDLVWIKNRSSSDQNNVLFDSVRGVQRELRSDSTGAESDYSATIYSLKSFDNNGFTVADITGGNYNVNGAVGGTYSGAAQFVAWCWKAADTTTTIAANTIGNTIASDVRANPDAGFSIVSYTGNGGDNQTVGHGLDATPSIIITKNRNESGSLNGYWAVGFVPNSTAGYLNLPADFDTGRFSAFFGSGINSNTFTVGTAGGVFGHTNENGDDMIAYCFADVYGYQKVGSYSGGSSGSGNVITTGFKPRFLLVKRTDASGDAWQMFDSIRGGGDTFDNYLQANEAYAETSYSLREVNFADNGFYWTNAESGTNISGGTYIYLAIA